MVADQMSGAQSTATAVPARMQNATARHGPPEPSANFGPNAGHRQASTDIA